MMTNTSLESAIERLRDRRAFLRFLASSPYIAALGGVTAAAFDTQQASTAIGDIITDPKDALDVMDFEEAAHRKVAITLFSILLAIAVILTVVGTFFRGPGWKFIAPWTHSYIEF